MRNAILASGLFLCCILAVTGCGDDEETNATPDSGATNDGGPEKDSGTLADSGTKDDASTSDSGSGDDAGDDLDDAGSTADAGSGACTDEPASPAEVGETQKSGVAPAAQGGTIADGLYYLSNFNVYPPGNADAHTRARLLKITGNVAETVNVDDDVETTRATGTVTTAGNELTFTPVCPTAGANPITIGYTATATEIWIHDESEPNVQIYVKQ